MTFRRMASSFPGAGIVRDAIGASRPAPVSRRVGFNSFWLFVTRLVLQMQLVLFTLLVARRLGAAGFGQYAFVASSVVLANVVTTFGTDTLLIRDVARTRSAADPVLPAALWIQLALSVAIIFIVMFGSGLIPNQMSGAAPSLVLYCLSLLPLAFYGVFTAVLRAHERMDLLLRLGVMTALLQLGGAWLALTIDARLEPLMLALVATHVGAALLAAALCRRFIPDFIIIRWHAPLQAVRETARRAWPLALLSILALIYQRLGVLMLALTASNTHTGWFTAATRVVEPLKIVHFAVLGALFPALTLLDGDGGWGLDGSVSKRTAAQLFRKSFLVLIGLGALAAFAIFVARGPLVALLYGSDYSPAVPILGVVVWGLIPYTISASLSLRLITQGRDRQVLRATTFGLLAALVLNAWLIPRYAALGAAWALLGSELVQTFVLLIGVRDA